MLLLAVDSTLHIFRVPALTSGQEPAAPDGLHVAAAAGAGEAVPGEQVPLQAQALRGGHHPRPLRDPGQTTDGNGQRILR